MSFFKINKKIKKLDQKSRLVNEIKDHVVILDNKKIDDFINNYSLSIIDFWAPWCNPCKKMAPRFRRLSTSYKGKVAFGKINTQEYPDIVKKYTILRIPYFGFFSYGKKIAELSGIKSVGEIKDTIDKKLKRIK
jgi:thioredoxin